MFHGAGLFINIYPKNYPNVGKYTMNGAFGGFWLTLTHPQ